MVLIAFYLRREVYFLPFERSELGRKCPPSGKSAHVTTREGQVFKAKVGMHAHFYAACYVCVGYPHPPSQCRNQPNYSFLISSAVREEDDTASGLFMHTCVVCLIFFLFSYSL